MTNCVTAALNMAQIPSLYGPTGAYYFPRPLKINNLTFTEIGMKYENIHISGEFK